MTNSEEKPGRKSGFFIHLINGRFSGIMPTGLLSDILEIRCSGELMTDLGTCSARQLVQSVVEYVTCFRRALARQDDITVFALVNRKTNSNEKL